jgi:hypothetical protein
MRGNPLGLHRRISTSPSSPKNNSENIRPSAGACPHTLPPCLGVDDWAGVEMGVVVRPPYAHGGSGRVGDIAEKAAMMTCRVLNSTKSPKSSAVECLWRGPTTIGHEFRLSSESREFEKAVSIPSVLNLWAIRHSIAFRLLCAPPTSRWHLAARVHLDF